MAYYTEDGRDLEYFAYSNHSIIAPGQFHGLREKEGEQIASYVRSNNAVFAEDIEMRSYLFEGGVTEEAISPDGIINMREPPVAIQLPDWNAWLPNQHPVDAWGNFFLESDEFTDENGKGDDILAW